MRHTSTRRGFFAAAVAAFAALSLSTSNAGAGYNVTFTRLTNVADSNVASQLRLNIQDLGYSSTTNSWSVRFVFRNVGSTASSITDIYFDDGSLVGSTFGLDFGSGVKYSKNANPGDLPGGNAINFNTSAGLSADSDSGAPGVKENGVNNATATSTTEWLQFDFDLKDGQKYADTIRALMKARDGGWTNDVTGGLRIGLHVQSIGTSGKSDSYYSTGFEYDGVVTTGGLIEEVPAPPAVVLAVMGVGLFGFVGRRMRRPAVA
jgi:hypothetical protein